MTPDEDPLTECKHKVLGTVFWLISLDLQRTVTVRLEALEAAAKRPLPEVRAQIAQLFGSSVPLALGAAEAETDDAEAEEMKPKSKAGRKKAEPEVKSLDTPK